MTTFDGAGSALLIGWKASVSEKILPRHLSSKITWRTWNYINTISRRMIGMYFTRQKVNEQLHFWQVRGWFISYVMNPQGNKDWLLDQLFYFRLVKDNLELMDILGQINKRQRSTR